MSLSTILKRGALYPADAPFFDAKLHKKLN